MAKINKSNAVAIEQDSVATANNNEAVVEETVAQETTNTASDDLRLPEHLRDKYKIVGVWPNKFEVTGLEVSRIEWSKMTEEFANHLIAVGFTGIQLK